MMRFSPQLRNLSWLVEKPIAHRGLHAVAAGILENTRSAFAAAIMGGYAIECDLQITADHEAMVFHDDRLERLMDAQGLLRIRKQKELQRLSYRVGKDRMQSLGELLDQVNGKVPLIVELKSHWDNSDRLPLRALKVLASYKGPYALMSFDPYSLAIVAENSPYTVRGIVADRTVDPFYNMLPLERRLELRSFSHLDSSKPHFVSYYFRDLPFAPVQRIRAAGHPLITWTLRSADDARVALRWSDQITFEGYTP